MEYSELDFLKNKLQIVTDIYEKFIAMKKITLQILFLFIAHLAQAQTIELVPEQLFGTWHASYTTGGGYGYDGVTTEFFFSASPTVPHVLAALGVFTKRTILGVSALQAHTCCIQPL